MPREPFTRLATLRPQPGVAHARAYRVPRAAAPIDLYLDGNEGAVPPDTVFDVMLGRGVDVVRRYPSAHALQQKLAARYGVEEPEVLVTCGGDDAIDRLCRAMLCPGRSMVLPTPTFQMIEHYAQVAGGRIKSVPWPDGRYPTEAVLDAVGPETGIVAVVSPNNPTGAVATADDLQRISVAAPHAAILLDHAYVEFAGPEHDLTSVAMTLPNVVVVRTLSKAWGLAGIRVGCALGPAKIVDWLRAAGGPYTVAGPSLAVAEAQLDAGDADVRAFVGRIAEERGTIADAVGAAGGQPQLSHANFVFARVPDATWLRDGLAGLGVAVRAFPGKAELDGCARITCPGDAEALERLTHGLQTVLRPEAILFDLDGVLADVAGSYRAAIQATAAAFGVDVSPDQIQALKDQGDANNDWVVTHRLIQDAGVETTLEAVTERFQLLYQGEGGRGGLRDTERLTVERDWLVALRERYPLAIVTGRPREDAEHFLREMGVRDLFASVVCMEDAPIKPDPGPVRLAMEQLGVRRAWMLGDTPDDVRAARGASVVPLGVVPPGADANRIDPFLVAAGAARVLEAADHLSEVLELLP